VLSKIIESSRRTPYESPGIKKSVKASSIFILPGSVEYMAPCMFKPDRGPPNVNLDFSTSIDIWTFGIMLYELKNGKTPFTGDDP